MSTSALISFAQPEMVLSRPLPLSGGSTGSDEVQAPPSILAWKPLLDALSTPGANQTGYPEGLKRIRAHCLQMLLRSVVFLSEALSYLTSPRCSATCARGYRRRRH